MTTEHETQPWVKLEEIIDSGNAEQLEAYLNSLAPGEAALALSRLDGVEQLKVLTTLEPQDAADLIDEIPDVQATALVDALSPERAAVILQNLDSDEQADVLGAIDAEHAEAVLAAMDPQEAAEARKLFSYAPDVAGGLMVTEYLSYPRTFTARNVIEDLRQKVDEYADYDVQYVFVVSQEEKLEGVLRLRDLVLTPSNTPVVDIMIPNPLSVKVDEPLDELGAFFDHHAFIGVPVVDEAGRLVGVVRRADVEDALGDRADSDYLKSQGIVGGEELRTMPLLLRSRRRLSWLSINIVLNVIAASVIAYFEETLAAVIALAVFLPIISDMSGCSGNQALAVSVRELALGFIRPNELLRVWLKEISVGLINGVALGILIALTAWVWKGNAYLGLVVGTALALNTMIAVSIGGLVPLVLKLVKQDPALASGPILTTVTDMCGFFFVLSFAQLMLPWLVGTS